MKREFLKNLGIEDKDIIDRILDENSADIGRAKGATDELKSQITQLQTQLNDRTNEFNTLKDSTKDYDSLKSQVNQLVNDNNNLKNEISTKVNQLQKTHAIESSVREAKAKNVKAVMALLDMDKISYENGELKGISDQLDALTKSEDTSFMFGETNNGRPTGTHPNTPPNGGNGGNPPNKSFTDAIAAALNSNK
jgi:chromosome segregation ATPase